MGCNDLKVGRAWASPEVEQGGEPRLRNVTEYGSNPEVTALPVVLGKLYELANRHTRAIVGLACCTNRCQPD